jgi:hypothetical protein
VFSELYDKLNTGLGITAKGGGAFSSSKTPLFKRAELSVISQLRVIALEGIFS